MSPPTRRSGPATGRPDTITTTTQLINRAATTVPRRCDIRGCPGRGTQCLLHPPERYPTDFAALDQLVRERPHALARR